MPTMTRATVRDAHQTIHARNAFRAGGQAGGMSGRYVTRLEPISFGRLPDEYRKQLQAAIRGIHPVYVVWSYDTPIGWVIDRGDVRQPFVPPVRYSMTTTRHQTQARRGLRYDGPWREVA